MAGPCVVTAFPPHLSHSRMCSGLLQAASVLRSDTYGVTLAHSLALFSEEQHELEEEGIDHAASSLLNSVVWSLTCVRRA